MPLQQLFRLFIQFGGQLMNPVFPTAVLAAETDLLTPPDQL
jgi:hypothetical protein